MKKIFLVTACIIFAADCWGQEVVENTVDCVDTPDNLQSNFLRAQQVIELNKNSDWTKDYRIRMSDGKLGVLIFSYTGDARRDGLTGENPKIEFKKGDTIPIVGRTDSGSILLKSNTNKRYAITCYSGTKEEMDKDNEEKEIIKTKMDETGQAAEWIDKSIYCNEVRPPPTSKAQRRAENKRGYECNRVYDKFYGVMQKQGGDIPKRKDPIQGKNKDKFIAILRGIINEEKGKLKKINDRYVACTTSRLNFVFATTCKTTETIYPMKHEQDAPTKAPVEI
jgi:hypothetical protein